MNVYEAMNAVQAELAESGIAKEQHNKQQNYAFRGIDQVYGALAPLLAKHKLLILPRATYHHTDIHPPTKEGGASIFHVFLNVEYDIISAEDGTTHTMQTVGEAMDYGGDKASNKALSAAYKYCVIQAFAIPVEGDDDADSESPQAQRGPKPSDKQLKFMKDLLGKLKAKDEAHHDQMKAWLGETPSMEQVKQGIDTMKKALGMED